MSGVVLATPAEGSKGLCCGVLASGDLDREACSSASRRNRSTPAVWLMMVSSCCATRPTRMVPRSRLEGSTVTAPLVPSPEIGREMLLLKLSAGRSIPARASSSAALASAPPAPRMRQVACERYAFARGGVKVAVRRRDPFPGMMPAAGLSSRTPRRLCGSAHWNIAGMAAALRTGSSREDDAPTQVGLNTRAPPGTPKCSAGRYPAPESWSAAPALRLPLTEQWRGRV
mmetsp:Transcript_14423/g.34162  ORF Transcript_14423/g.34162 Transcript_14423/m.34162 type:complete len:229 (+) Transcript_14423:57-743(+)